MEEDVYNAFLEAFPKDGATAEERTIERINQFVQTVYIAYKDKLAEKTLDENAELDLVDEKNKNKDKAKDIITTK